MRLLNKSAMIAAVAAIALLSITGPAKADPPAGVTPAASDIVGVGSDTTEFVNDQFSYDYNSTSPTNKLYSWDATGPSPITPKTGATSITRPDGSSAGINALINNTSATLDFARSSRDRVSEANCVAGGYCWVLLADDAVTYATDINSTVSPTLTTTQLKNIYTSSTCTDGGITYKPYLPQTGSGTRAFFLSAIGATNYSQPSCVGTVQENDGTAAGLTDAQALVPYSVSKYIAQAYHSTPLTNGVCTPDPVHYNRFGCDQHGSEVLRSPDSQAPTSGSGVNTVIDSTFAGGIYGRSVYTVVRYDGTTGNHIPSKLQPIFNPSNGNPAGYVCGQTTTLQNDGLLSNASCGTVH